MLNLEELGITKDDLVGRVVEKLCESLLREIGTDEDGDEVSRPSSFQRRVQELIKKRVDERITHIAETNILPNVSTLVENIVLQETNKWGEKTGKAMTFIEYMTQRADAYLREDVDYEGKDKASSGSYNWSKSQTRITHLVHRHLHHTIETAMKDAIKNVNSVIVAGIQETVKIKLEEVAKSLKLSVATK